MCNSRTPTVRGYRSASPVTILRIVGRSRTSPGLTRYASNKARVACSGRFQAHPGNDSH